MANRMCTRNTSIFCGYLAILYAIINVCLFVYTFAVGKEPDWITLFKLLCHLILLSSAALAVAAVYKDNVIAMLIAELMMLSALIGYIIYSLIMLISFIKQDEVGTTNFFIYLLQRIIFLVFLLIFTLMVELFRKDEEELQAAEKWTDLSDSCDEPDEPYRDPIHSRYAYKIGTKDGTTCSYSPDVKFAELEEVKYNPEDRISSEYVPKGCPTNYLGPHRPCPSIPSGRYADAASRLASKCSSVPCGRPLNDV